MRRHRRSASSTRWAPGAGHYAVFAESPLPANRRSKLESNSAFSDLDYAVYLGRGQKPSQLILTSVKHLPLQGADGERRASRSAPDRFTIAITPRGSLGGSLLPQPAVADRDRRRGDLAGGGAADRAPCARAGARGAAGGAARQARRREPRALHRAAQHRADAAAGAAAGAAAAAAWAQGERALRAGAARRRRGRGLVRRRRDRRPSRAARDRRRVRSRRRRRPRRWRWCAMRRSPTWPRTTALAPCWRSSPISSAAGENDYFATVLCALIDIDAHRLTLSSAGHLAPLLLSGRERRVRESQAEPPIGFPHSAPFREATVTVPPESTLVAFTDGLVERRGEVLDEGLARLREMAMREHLGDDDLACEARARPDVGRSP